MSRFLASIRTVRLSHRVLMMAPALPPGQASLVKL